MRTGEAPTLLDIDSRESAAAIRAFISWAGSDRDLKVLFTPDVLMAIDTSRRRGVLIDEVYFVTVWVDRDVTALRDRLRREHPGDEPWWVEPPVDHEPDPEQLLSTGLVHGHPIATVRHLL